MAISVFNFFPSKLEIAPKKITNCTHILSWKEISMADLPEKGVPGEETSLADLNYVGV